MQGLCGGRQRYWAKPTSSPPESWLGRSIWPARWPASPHLPDSTRRRTAAHGPGRSARLSDGRCGAGDTGPSSPRERKVNAPGFIAFCHQPDEHAFSKANRLSAGAQVRRRRCQRTAIIWRTIPVRVARPAALHLTQDYARFLPGGDRSSPPAWNPSAARSRRDQDLHEHPKTVAGHPNRQIMRGWRGMANVQYSAVT